MTKKFWKSKGVWIGICTILIGIVEIVRQVLKVVERFASTGESVTL